MRQAGEAPASGKDQAYRPSAMRHPRGGCDAPDAYRAIEDLVKDGFGEL